MDIFNNISIQIRLFFIFFNVTIKTYLKFMDKINIINLRKQIKRDPKTAISYNLLKASWLQKSIRRGLKDKAYFIGNLYLEDNQEEGLKRRLKIFSTEDIGIATPEIIFVLDHFRDNPLKQIIALSGVYKNREVDRFLLNTRDRYDNLIQSSDKELQNEVLILNEVLELSTIWFNNKRKNAYKNDIYNYFKNLDKNNSYSKEINLCLTNYFHLSKHKTLGARTQLAFLVLLILRNIEISQDRVNDIIKKVDTYKIKSTEFRFVDDWAVDKHTIQGKKLHRGYDFWVEFGSKVHPEKDYPSLYDEKGNLKYHY